jgi:hypothetical protein
MRRILVRITTAWRILTGVNKHWFFISLTTDELKKSLNNEDLTISVVAHKLQKFNVLSIMNGVIENLHSEDLLLERMKFEAGAEERARNNNNNKK